MPEEQVVPQWTYDQTRDIYEKARLSPFFKDMSLSRFSATANEITGTQQFAMGLNDNILKQANYHINKLLKPVSEPLGQLGAGTMEAVGLPQYADIGQRLGELLPRGAIETLALFTPHGQAAAVPRALAWGARLLGAASQGTQTYSATDSAGAGMFTGATSLLMPKIVQAAHAAVPKLFGNMLGLTAKPASEVTGVGTSQAALYTGIQEWPERVAQKTLEATARNLAFMGFGETQLQGSQLLATGQLLPYTDEHLVELAAGQLAFAPLDLLGITRPGVKTATEQITAQAVRSERAALKQRMDAAVDDAKRGGPLGPRTAELMETLDKVEQKRVAKAVGITQSRVTRALQQQQGFELDDLTMPKNAQGIKAPLRGKALDAVRSAIDDLVQQGLIKLDGTKVVPVAKFDLKGQLNLLDGTGEAQAQARVQREAQAQATAAAVLGKVETAKPEASGAKIEGEEPPWRKREEGEPVGEEGDVRTQPSRMEKLEPALPAPAEAAISTAERAWRILSTPGGVQDFVRQMNQFDEALRLGAFEYTDADARKWLVAAARPAAQEAWQGVSAEAKAELARMSQLAVATAEPVGKPVVKKPLVTEPTPARPTEYKGPGILKEVKEPPMLDARDITNVKDIDSARTFVDAYWTNIWRKVQGYAKRQVTKEVEIESPTGEVSTKPVTTTETVLARKPGMEGVDIGDVHEQIVSAAMQRLKERGVEVKREDFAEPPVPDMLAQALGWDQVRPGAVDVAGRMQQIAQMIGDWYGIEATRLEDLVTDPKTMIEPSLQQQVELADARIEQLLGEAYRLAESDPGLKNALWQAEGSWQYAMDQITSVQRPAVEMMTMVKNAMLRRVETLDSVLKERSQELVARAVARMEKTSLNNVSKELGVPRARMDEVMQIVNAYDKATVQRVQVKDADGKQIIKTTRGPIIEELLRVMYKDEVIKWTAKGGKTKIDTPAAMLNVLAAYRIVEWGARLIQGLEAEDAVMSGKPTKLSPEANLFTRYTNLVVKERGGRDKYKPASRETLIRDVAREAIYDLVMIPQRKRSKYGEASPAWEQYALEGKTKWRQNDSDAYALAMADTEHAMSGSEAEVFDGVDAYDKASYTAAMAGKGGPIGAGTEMDVFFRKTAQRLANGFRFTPEMVKGLAKVQVVFNEDFTLDRAASLETNLKRSFSEEQTKAIAAELNATLDILTEPENWGFKVRQDPAMTSRGKKYVMSLELVPRTLEDGSSEGRTAAQWRVINKLGKVSPELRATHEFLTGTDAPNMTEAVQSIRETWQGEDFNADVAKAKTRPFMQVLEDNAVARAQGVARRAGQKVAEVDAEAVRAEFNAEFKADWKKFIGEKGTGRWFFKKYVDKLQSDYMAGVDSSYTNWQQNILPRALEAVAALEFNAGKKEVKGAAIEGEYVEGARSPWTDERSAAAELLNEVTTDQQLTAGLWAHFQDHFSKMGMEKKQASFYADIAARIGAAFPRMQQGTIVDLVDPRFAGTYVGQASRKYLIGLTSEGFRNLPVGEKSAMMFHFAAHEIAHGLYSKHNYANLTAEQLAQKQQNLLWAQSIGPEGRRAVLAQAFDVVLPIMKRNVELVKMGRTRFAEGAKDPYEFIMDLTALSVLGLASPDPAAHSAVAWHYLMSDAHVQNVLRSVFVPLLDVAAPLASYFEQRLPAEWAGQFQKLVAGTKKVLNTTTEEINAQVARLMQLEQAEPAVFYDAVAKGYKPDIKMLGADDTQIFARTAEIMAGRSETAGAAIVDAAKALWGAGDVYAQAGGGKEVAMPIRWFFTAGQLAQRYPVLRPMFQLAFRYFGDANAAAQKIMGHMLRKRPWLGVETLDAEMTGFKRVLADERLQEAFNDIACLKQGSVDTGEDRHVLTDAEMIAVAEKHGVRGKEDQLAIINLHKNFEIAAPKIREHTINMLVKTLSVRMLGSRLMQMDGTLSPDVAIARAHELGAQVWQSVEGGMPLPITDPVQLNAVQSLQAAFAPLKEFADNTRNNAEAWMPEVRIGRWKIAYWEKRADGKWYGGVQSAADKPERDAKLTTLQARTATDREHAEVGQVVSVRPWDAWTKREDTNQGQPMWRLLNEMSTGSLKKRLIDAGVTDPALHAKIFDDNWSPITSAMEAAEARDVQRLTKQRQLRPGRETLNMAQGFLHQANHIPRALSQMYADAEASLRLDAPELRGEGALRELARKHFKNVVHPQAAEMTSLKKFIFAYFMGFNISSILIEPTQQLIALLPSLTRDTGSIIGSMKMWGKATSLAVRKAMHKGVSGDADLDAALAQAEKDQITSFGIMQELYNAEDYGALNVASALSAGRPLWNAKRLATSAFNAYVNSARRFYSVAPMVNNVLAFSAAYITARDHGVFVPGTGKLQKLQGKAAYDYAASVTQAAMGGGGVAGRPVELFHGMGKATGVVGAMYSLATYSMLMMSHVARLGLDAIGSSKGLTSVERRAAQKALGQTLMTQGAFAGALGLPMATGVLALLEQMFPGLKANEAVQDTVQQLVGEDDDMGGFFTDLVMRGVPNALLGVDTSSRLQLSNVLGVSQYDGFKLENLLGPTGSIIGNAFRATQDVQRGKIADGVERLLPTAFKNIAQMYRDDWTVKDWKGHPLYEPSGGELALQLVGLRPNAVTKLRDAQKMAKRSEEVARAEGGAFTDKLAQWLVDGEVQKVQEALVNKERTQAGYSAVEGARTVADKATKMMFPLDFAREGVRVDAQTRQKLALSGGVQQTPEVQWLETKKRLEGVLGIPGGGRVGRTELMMAQLVDQIRAMNPLVSVQEAREQAQMMLGRGAPPALQAPFGQMSAGL